MNSDRTQRQIGSHGPALRAFQRQAARRISSVLSARGNTSDLSIAHLRGIIRSDRCVAKA